MLKKNRILTLLLAAVVIFVMLSSVFFIAIEADHDCVGEGCSICYQISVCENTLKTIGLASVVAILAAFVGTFMLFLPSLTERAVGNISLVTLKVKLSN